MALDDISADLVTEGKPVDGGCCYISFASSPTYPTDATTALGSDWESAGELSSNGFTESKNISTTDHTGWHGTNLLTTIDSETETVQVEFVEINRGVVAKLKYGSDNVEVDSDGTVSHITSKNGMGEPVAIVFEELESNGYKRRTLYRKTTVTNFDDVSHTRGDLMVYGMTFTAATKDGKTSEVWRAAPSSSNGD